jgi:hypothetical protein
MQCGLLYGTSERSFDFDTVMCAAFDLLELAV